ncbi:hypothetical protein D2M30_4102 [Bacillus amyloliquefaciens]|nr:hypothetical protein D2M30_4102 [Bacillus amyloliquefaciens]
MSITVPKYENVVAIFFFPHFFLSQYDEFRCIHGKNDWAAYVYFGIDSCKD